MVTPAEERGLAAVGRFARRRGAWLVAAALALTLPGLLVLPRVRIKTDPASLFRADDPAVADYRYFSDNFGLADLLILAVRGDSPGVLRGVGSFERRLRASEYFRSLERRHLGGAEPVTVLVLFTRKSAMDRAFSRAMLAEVRRLAKESGVNVERTGPPVFVEEAQASARRDVARTGLLAVVLVAGILVVFFRDPLFPLAASMPLVAGIVGCVAFAHGVFGGINLLVAALPTSLVGIGIDYALHLRSARLMCTGAVGPAAWGRVYGDIGLPILVGMLTTVAAFFALLVADLRVLPEMGVAGGVGTVLIFAATFLLVPVLMDWRDRLGWRFRPLPTDWLGRLARGAVRHRRRVLATFVLATVPLLVLAMRVRIGSDPEAYNPNLASRRLYLELASRMDLVTTPILVATRDLRAERRVLDRLAEWIGPGRVFKRVDSVSSIIDRLPGAALWRRLFSARPEWLRWHPVARRFIGRDGRMCMVLYPGFDPYVGDGLARIRQAVAAIRERAAGDVVRLSGTPVIYDHLFRLVRGDLLRTGWVAAAVVFAMLVVLLRRPRDFLAAMAPLAGGVIWMFGILHAAGFELTAFNVISMPLVVGLGVDYGVHLVHRLRGASVEAVMTTTGRAILAASATTAAALFGLCLSETRAAVGMGMAGGVGILSCLAWSLFFLPALLGRPEVARDTREST